MGVVVIRKYSILFAAAVTLNAELQKSLIHFIDMRNFFEVVIKLADWYANLVFQLVILER